MIKGKDRWFDAFKEQVGNTEEGVPEGLFEAVLGKVRRRRRNRRFAVWSGVVAAAAAAVLPFMLSSPQKNIAPILTSEAETVEAPILTTEADSLETPVSRQTAGSAVEYAPVSSPEEYATDQPSSIPLNAPQDAVKREEAQSAPKTEEKKLPVMDLYADLFDESDTPVNTPLRRGKLRLSLSLSPSGGGVRAETVTMLKYVSSSIPDYYDRIAMLIRPDDFQTTLVEETDPSGKTKSTFVMVLKNEEELEKRIALLDKESVVYKHRMPVNLRFVVACPLSGRLSLETGLSYSLLHSSVFVGHSTIGLGQNIHLAGIPLGLRLDLFSGERYSIYAKGGGVAEKCLGFTVDGEKNKPMKPWFWSVEAAAGAQYNFYGPLWLFGEAGGSYHFENAATYLTIYGEKPLLFSLQAGLRVGL